MNLRGGRHNLTHNVHACWVASVVSDSVWPYGLQTPRLLCPWDSPGKNTGVGCHFLLQGIVPSQGSNLASPALAGRLFTPGPLGKLRWPTGTFKHGKHWPQLQTNEWTDGGEEMWQVRKASWRRPLAMKAAAIWEEMRSIASNCGPHLAAGWNHLWGFVNKKCWLLPPLPRGSDLTEMRLQPWDFTELPLWFKFAAKFANRWPLPYLKYKGPYLDEETVNRSGDSAGAGACVSVCGGWGEWWGWGKLRDTHPSWRLWGLPWLSVLLTWTPGFCCHLVVVFSMAPLSLEVSYKPRLSISISRSVVSFCDPVDCIPPGSSVHGIL